jgi:hypothetical protein
VLEQCGQLYDEEGELRVPKEWEGQKIRGLGDGEYLETEELLCREEGVEFDASSLHLALAYCEENEWDKYEGFQKAWDELSELVAHKYPQGDDSSPR